jgi:hypothetical protein
MLRLLPNPVFIPVVALLATALAVPAAHAQSSAAAQAPGKPRASVLRVEPNAIKVDGVLDEEAWQRAKPIGRLVQREPLEGAEPTEATEVRIVYTEQALYFAVLCRDRTPAAIVSTQLTRDADLESDDSIFIILDPFFDHRNGFFFQVNPAGARADGQVSNNAEHRTLEWDGIWDAAARVTSDGWVAEIAIPFKTLRFKPGQSTWGLNVERTIKRRNETDRWASPRRDVWISNLAEAGELDGLQGIQQGRGLDIRPYISAGDENGDAKMQPPGVDVFKNLTPNMNASVTVNTDFAETEVDARQINLTRFPLFFPEKRAFFLEGAGVFDVAATNSSYILPFFSRRIGLLEGREVPILVGTEIVGRQSGYNIGVLDVQTRDLEDNPNTGQNLLAARVSRNLFTQSWVGAILTHGNPEGTGSNTLVGADLRLATSSFRGDKNLSSSWFLLRTDDQASGTQDYAFGGNVDYPNDLWDVSFGARQIGEHFKPALGFAPRTGVRIISPGAAFMPRPGRWGIRKLYFEASPTVYMDLHNVVQDWRVFTAPFNMELDSGDHFEFNYMPQFERLPEPFDITDTISIPAGTYQATRWGVQVETADKRPWVLRSEVAWGGFYSGTRVEVVLGAEVKPSTHFLFGVEVERNDVKLVEGTFQTQVVTVRANYNFSPNVSWANLVQYDNESRVMGVQSRFRWILKPGSDFFLVLNRGWYRREFDGHFLPYFDKGSVKLQYTFRL